METPNVEAWGFGLQIHYGSASDLKSDILKSDLTLAAVVYIQDQYSAHLIHINQRQTATLIEQLEK